MKLLRNLSITLKLTLVFILFATFVLLGLSVPAYLNARYSLRSAAVSELLATSLEKEAALNAWVENRQHNILDIASQPHLQEIMQDYLNLSAGSPAARLMNEEITRNLQNWTGEGHLFISMQILEADSGRILLSTNPVDVGKFREQEAFFIKGRDGSVIENPVYDLSSASYVMMSAAPIVASDGSLLAVLAGSLDLTDMDTIIQRRTGLHQMDDTFLVNTSHLFVTQPRLQTDATVVQHGIDTIAVNTCLERNSGVYEGNDYRGIPAIVVYRWMGERNMCLIVKIDQQEAYSTARALSMTFLLVGGLVLLAGSLASIAIARSMSQPLHDLLEETIQLGQGNLERRIQVRSSDEIGKVGQAFNQMAGSLQAQDIQLREWSGELEQKVEQRTLELSNSEERYRNILETIEDGYYEIDLEGAFTFFNPALSKIYRIDPHELMGMNSRRFMDTENVDITFPVFNQVYRTGLPAHGIEWEVTCKDGEKLFVESSVSPIKNSEGGITGFRGIVRDVTQRKQAEEDLHRSESELRALFAALPDVVLMLDKDGRYLKITETNQDLLYKPLEELIGKTLHDVFPINEADRFIGYILEVLNSNKTIRFEYSLRIKDKEKWFATTVTPMTEDTVIWVARDVSESKQAEIHRQRVEDDLRASEERYRNILETIEDGYFEIDLKGSFTFFNPALPKIYRYDPHELMGMNYRQYMDTENAIIVYQAFNQVYRTGLPAHGIVWEVTCKDGEKLFIEGSASLIKNSEGGITGFRGIVRDVTQRKLASVLLLESEAKYRSLFDNVPDGVYRSSPDGSILAANKALVTMLGFDSDVELIKTNASQVYTTQDDRNQYLKEIDEYGFVKNLEVHLRTKQGEPIVGLENARAYYAENGKVLYYEGTLTDITEYKQVELERQTLLEIMQGLTVTDDLHDYLEIVHHAIGKVVYAKNFFIVLKDNVTGLFEEPYFVDKFDQPASSYELGKSISAYVYRSGKPYLYDPESFVDLVAKGEVELVGSDSPSWLGVPLIISNETIGVMVVQDYETKDRFSDHDLEFLTSISGGVAQAIRRKSAESELAQLFESEQRRSQRLSDLQILGTELTSLHSEQDVLERLVNTAALLSHSPVCTVMMLDSNTEEIILAAHFGLPASVPKGLRIPMALLPEAARAFRSGKTIIISNIDQEMPAMRKVLVHPGVQSFFAFPLLLDGVVTGAITLSSMQPRHPSEAEIKTYELLARLVSAALENVRLFEGVNRSLQRMESLRRVDMAISASFDLVMTLNILLEQITTHLGVDAADILVLDATDATLKYTCGRGFRSQALRYTNLRVGEGFAGQAAMESRTIHVPDLQEEMHGWEKSSSLPSEGFVSYWGVPLLAKGSVRGVLEVFNRQPISVDKDWINFMETLAGQAAIAIDNVQLFNHLERSNADLALAYDSTLTGWATALELRDNETEGHTRRVAITTTLLAGRMGVRDEEIRFIRWGALLHDIGKMGIPDSILLKPGPLSEEEWVIMRTHPGLAYEMLSPINYLSNALDIPYCHHEKWDGSGYPRGLKGVQIPLAARIFAIVDVWDALTSDRPYRLAWTPEKTMKYIQEQVGTHFDPQVAKAFFEMIGPDGKLPGE